MASPRSFDEAMGLDSDQSDHENGSQRKRQRTSSHEPSHSQNSGDEADEDQPVLPDEYRRSPQRARATHQPGSIVRVTMKNFVTYTKAEFHPGPNLNMVIGPNGTGKSTLVCAICLGLGWKTDNLGRAKDVGEFVKHGSARATIEIELAKDPKKHQDNLMITTQITKEGNKVEFLLNGKKSSKKEIQRLCNSFSIQVDNLCQFLPQERVVEFATLTPVQLLTETQRAAAPPEMSERHDQLKALGKDAMTKTAGQQALLESLKRLQDRQRAQQADVDRIREHSTLQERLAALQRFKPWPAYREKKEEFEDVKRKQRRAARSLATLQQQLEPSLRAADEKAVYATAISNVIETKKRLIKRTGEETSKINKTYEERRKEITRQIDQHKTEKESIKAARMTITKIEHTIQKLQADMKNAPPVFDPAAMNEEIRDLSRQIRTIEDQETPQRDSIQEWKGQILQRKQVIREKEAQKEHLQSQLGRQSSKLAQVSRDAATAWEWVQRNQQLFEGEVFGPPMITCTVKDNQLAAGIEQLIGRRSLVAFTVTSKSDFLRLQEQFHGQMHLKEAYIHTSGNDLERWKPPCSAQDLHEYGLQGWALDMLEGPPEVLAMLCSNNAIENMAYLKGRLDDRQMERLRSSPVTAYFTNTECSTINRRREYGDQAVSVRVNTLRPASYFTGAPISNDREQQIDRHILERRDEIETLTNDIIQAERKLKELQEQRQVLQQAKESKQKEKNARQSAKTAFDALPTRLEGEQVNLAAQRDKIKGFNDVSRAHDEDIDKLHIEKGQLALNLANSVEQFRVLHMELLAIELMEIEAKSDATQLRARHAAESQQLSALEGEVAILTAQKEKVKSEALTLQEECQRIGQDLSASEHEICQEVEGMTVDRLDAEIRSAEARLEMNTGGNRHVLKEFEQREKQIASKQTQVEETKTALEELATQIQEIRESWEPRLQEIIDKISASFAENFESINCAGEVGLYKDEDFEQWAIQIKVKFRENEPLSLLDSHRQSGGERAVSTIFYLMALQSLARAPFRVVDEINQGMDPRNERLVHSRLVSIACQSSREDGSGGSQYFLITPKLLNGLEYHPNMKVHCIASGEWMPSDHTSLNFQQLAQRALSLRATAA